MSKRVKFSFSSINEGKISVIKAEDVAASNQRIKLEMIPVVKLYKKKEAPSIKDASKFILNG